MDTRIRRWSDHLDRGRPQFAASGANKGGVEVSASCERGCWLTAYVFVAIGCDGASSGMIPEYCLIDVHPFAVDFQVERSVVEAAHYHAGSWC